MPNQAWLHDKKPTKKQAKSLPVFPKKTRLKPRPVYYDIGGVTPGGDCKLTPKFSHADPRITAEKIVANYSATCGLSYKPHGPTSENLISMIVAAIEEAVSTVTGKSEAYRKVREAILTSKNKHK